MEQRKLTDLCTGLWGFKSHSIAKLDIGASGFDLEAEIVGKIRRARLNHIEIPVNWSARKGGIVNYSTIIISHLFWDSIGLMIRDAPNLSLVSILSQSAVDIRIFLLSFSTLDSLTSNSHNIDLKLNLKK